MVKRKKRKLKPGAKVLLFTIVLGFFGVLFGIGASFVYDKYLHDNDVNDNKETKPVIKEEIKEETYEASLIAVGDSELIKIHFHTNEPWEVLKYCSTLGEIHDIVVEDMIRQAKGLQG